MTEWATMPEVAYLFGWSESYARKLAHRDRWRRHGYAPRVYNLCDVGRSASLTAQPKGYIVSTTVPEV